MMTVKEIRKTLKQWGNFWYQRRFGPGFTSTSATHKLCEQLKTGVQGDGSQAQFNRTADNVFVPQHIEKVDDAIEKLSVKCRLALVNKYINKSQDGGYFEREAELHLMKLL